MNYEEKYKQALETVQEILSSGADLIRIKRLKLRLQSVFPELKESEDERIRKTIIRFFKDNYPNETEMYDGSVTVGKALAWLEKQGEKIDAIENFDTEFEKQVSCLIASAINMEHEYNQGYVKWAANALLEYAKHELEKQGEKATYINKEDCGIDGLYHAIKILEETVGRVTGYQSDDGILEHKAAINAVKELYKKQGEKDKPKTWCAEDEQNLDAVLCFIPDEYLRRWLKDKLSYDLNNKLNADKVIEWIEEHVPTKFEDMQNYVENFRKAMKGEET